MSALKKQKISTIIFDFDGTIADTLPFTFKKIIEIIRRLKITDKSERLIWEEIRSKNYRQLIKDYKLSWLKLPWIISATRKAQQELSRIIEKIMPFSNIKTVLTKLDRKGLVLGILSSNLKENIERFLKAHKIFVFDFIHCEKNLLGKAQALKNLIKKYRLDHRTTVYVGDEIRDIEACKKAGIKIISVSWGFNYKKILKNYRPDYLIDKPNEILNIVES